MDNSTITNLRKELHRNPEVSGKEYKTAERVVSFLKNHAPDQLISGVAETGIIAIYQGKSKGKNILFRCELDALPIAEVNSFTHRSVVANVSHKCGHDGHMAILCGLAMKLSKNPPEKGDVILLFQPAEEDGSGARKVLESPPFQTLKPDFVFALHNLPGFEKGEIIIKDGTFTCAVNSIIIKLKGKTAHAGEPENGINPALAIAEIINRFTHLTQPDITKTNFCLITPIYIHMGEKAYGVSAGDGEIHFTIRSNNNKNMDDIEKMIETTAMSIANESHLECQLQWIQQFRANENNTETVFMVKNAAANAQLLLSETDVPFSWGEDFGLFTEHFPGALFGLGAGRETPSLHNPDYDFPDDITATGVTIFHQIINTINNAQ